LIGTGLQVVIGHLGEGLQIVLPRLDQQYHLAAGMEKLPSEVLRQHVHVTMCGFFMKPSFMTTLDAFGADRIMFSANYPFGYSKKGVASLEDLPLSPADRAKIEHLNADRLFKLNAKRSAA
jgi:predicted TIM-barrel fold metal-dependent hydrolase